MTSSSGSPSRSVHDPPPRSPKRWRSPRASRGAVPRSATFGLAVGQPQTNVDAIAEYFRENGLTVLPLAAYRLSFKVTGSVARIQTALAVSFGTYRDRAGHRYYSTSGDPYLPADLATLVQAIYGLDNYPALQPYRQPIASLAGPYTPVDLRAAYDVNPLYQAGFKGDGQTIGILGCDDFLDSDIQGFEQLYGMPTAPLTRVSIDDGPTGTDPEATVDLEWSLAIAPDASIVYYGFSSGGG
jgi:subtilase family serine protease